MKDGFDLSGQVILITGASSGIGARFGKTLAVKGAKVVLTARRTDRLNALATEIIESGGEALAVAMDVSDEASIITGFDAAEKHFGRIDTVIANAGREADRPVMDLSVEDFDGTIAVNLRGVFLTSREGARRISKIDRSENQDGRIIIISSVTAKKVTRGLAAYSATKAAVSQMGKVMALEWARLGINVNMVLPGYILTDINSASFETDRGKMFIKSFPRRRLVDQSDLDGVINFLCSSASKSVTGTEIIVDDAQQL
ncbi:SDR family oxidoreductase [Hellea sp.]|nr:SDR family oxidoreductase [Hellea sp.]